MIDITIIRPEVRQDEIKHRGSEMSPGQLKAVKKGLHAFHTLEVMAANIYKFQITGSKDELNRQLVAAMLNEMTHIQDFQVKLYEYGWKPSKLRIAYWFVGLAFGLGSRLLGRKAILKTAIWVETKAVHHYKVLLETIDWDDDTRRVIEKDQADEDGHISRWQNLLTNG